MTEEQKNDFRELSEIDNYDLFLKRFFERFSVAEVVEIVNELIRDNNRMKKLLENEGLGFGPDYLG